MQTRNVAVYDGHGKRLKTYPIVIPQSNEGPQDLLPGEALPCSERPRNRLGFAATLNGLVDYHSHLCVLVDREGHGVSLEALHDDRLTAALLSAIPYARCAYVAHGKSLHLPVSGN